MKKILILYFSGVGATKKVAEQIYACLSRDCEVDMFSVENSEAIDINRYDALVMGTPTYHAAPAKIIMGYVYSMPVLSKQVPAFVYNTRSLCSLNTNRLPLCTPLPRNGIIVE